MIYEDDYSFARACMGPDEHILWRGRPQKGHMLTPSDVFMIPFSIFWCGFAIFWETSVILSSAPFPFCIFGIPFVCIGLYLVFGRFVWTAFMRKRTAYVITNKKIIRMRGTKIDVLSAATMPAARTEYFKDGNGTIYFQTDPYGRRTGMQVYSAGWNMGGFVIDNVPEVNRVLQAIESMEK